MPRKTHAPKRDERRSSAGRPVFLVVGLLAVGVILIAVVMLVMDRSAESPRGPARVGAAIADFTLTGISGRQVRLSDYVGRPVLINAWATWCPPCREEMPALHDFYRTHQAEGFALLAANAGEAPAQVQRDGG